MDLFLLRHGSAEPAAVRDRDRKLTAEGRDELTRVLSDSAVHLQGVSLALVSPYLRAQQTFEFALNFLPALAAEQKRTVDFLVPGGNPRKTLDWLTQQPQNAKILMVTHQPLVGTLVDELCGFETGRYRMGTGSLAALRMEIAASGTAELLWLRNP